ncbi:MAG: hypothetical protein ACFFAS_12730 [Promethearchaeota archaeon]
MSEDNYIALRKFFNEDLLKDLLLFLLLFVLIISQEWQNILLILFPLIAFVFSSFFKFIGTNKWRLQQTSAYRVLYNPIGSEIKHASRLFYCAIVMLVLTFWIGAESLYRPQLINVFSNVFTGVFAFAYSFGFYWIFVDLWKYGKISILKGEGGAEKSIIINKNEEIVKLLKLKEFSRISMLNLCFFLVLNALNIINILLIIFNNSFGIAISLPGKGLESSFPMIVPYITIGILIVSPALAIVFLVIVYKKISATTPQQIENAISSLPQDIQVDLKNKLRAMSEKAID